MSVVAGGPPTSDLQPALHLVLAQLVDGPAGVATAVELTGLPDVERQYALFVLHQVLGVLTDDHVVLHPDDFWLSVAVRRKRRRKVGQRFSSTNL